MLHSTVLSVFIKFGIDQEVRLHRSLLYGLPFSVSPSIKLLVRLCRGFRSPCISGVLIVASRRSKSPAVELTMGHNHNPTSSTCRSQNLFPSPSLDISISFCLPSAILPEELPRY